MKSEIEIPRGQDQEVKFQQQKSQEFSRNETLAGLLVMSHQSSLSSVEPKYFHHINDVVRYYDFIKLRIVSHDGYVSTICQTLSEFT